MPEELSTSGSGPAGDDLLEDLGKYVNPGRSRIYRLMGMTNIEYRGEGSRVIDEQGNEFIDLCAGYAVLNMGHRHPTIIEAVTRQLEKMGLATKTMLSRPEVDLARSLADITPGGLQRSFFCASGAEAVEVALKVARMHTGRKKIVATEGGFHGKTLGALSATSKGTYRDAFGPLLPGFIHVPYDDLAALQEAVDENTAAVIVEVIQGESGVVIPGDDYLPGVRRICDDAGALVIFDEVQTGLGRTGANFACEHYDVVPDIMTLAKSLGGGVVPLGAAIVLPEIFDVFDENPWIHSSTTGGNPVAASAGYAALQVLQEENLAEQAREKGDWALEYLKRVQYDYPTVISGVSGRGLLLGMHFADPSGGVMVLTELFNRGVLVVPSLMNWTVMRIAPPLNIPDEDLHAGLKRVRKVVEEVAPQLEEM